MANSLRDLRNTQRGDGFLTERDHFETIASRRTVDYVQIEIVVGEAGVLGVGSEANLQFRFGGEKFGQARGQLLRCETWRTMHPQKLRPATGNLFDTTSQIVKSCAGVTHQIFAGWR